jgi:predicted RNase H-like nuclease (RuvC/YqgF family)
MLLNEGIDASIYVAIISTASALLIGALTIWAERKKRDAGAVQVITESSIDLIGTYREEVDRLGARIDSQDSTIRKLKNRVTSVEHDARIAREALIQLEKQHESLQSKMRNWSKGIEILIAQIERHDSSPAWRPEGD